MPKTAVLPRVETHLIFSEGMLFWRVSGMRGKPVNQRGRGANFGANTRERQEDRERWKALLLAALSRREVSTSSSSWHAPQPAEITVRVYGRPMDADGVGTAHKYAIDAMVAVGLLVDDGPKYVRRCIGDVPPNKPRPSWCPVGPGVEIIVGPAL